MSELFSKHYEELYHHGVKGMKWGIKRYKNKDGSLTSAGKKQLDKKKAKLDARDLDYYRKNITIPDLTSEHSKKIAGKQIIASGKAWTDYYLASNGGKINNNTTKALRKKYEEANIDMLNALISDIRVPSGRNPKWILDENEEKKLIFE